ncbi:MAG: aminomethyl-transferring glycine dehydrogenase [Thermostichales cyanobacterium DRC_bins_46]
MLPPFVQRHVGIRTEDVPVMLASLGVDSLETLIAQTLPKHLYSPRPLKLPTGIPEGEALAELRQQAAHNQVWRSYIGMGYANCYTPAVIQRNILENPGWYTQYTPYQAEIAQGRLEALLNFQTLISDLTGLDVANASLLDEGTAAAEALTMALAITGHKPERKTFLVDQGCHPQVIAVVQTRAEPLGVKVLVGDPDTLPMETSVFGMLLAYPTTWGEIPDYRPVIERAHQQGVIVIMATDPLSLTLLPAPGDLGADIAIGNSQRFGIPLGYGGPHAAYLATREAYKRLLPGRLVGVSRDGAGDPALRLALQTREQHIRRDKATSNICTAQVLLAVMASMYAVYHGPEGLRGIADRVHQYTCRLAVALEQGGYRIINPTCFDTLTIATGERLLEILERAEAYRINLRPIDRERLGVTLDETVTEKDFQDLCAIFAVAPVPAGVAARLPQRRQTPFLTHPVFHAHRSETELLRYIHQLQSRDLSLTTSMMPLGSCTMKLNATSEMLPISWPEFAQIHPFVPLGQTLGYQALFRDLQAWLGEITGFAAVSLQPNAGSQGEYAGLLVIRAYHHHRGQGSRNVCLIPQSAHGTNPASAVMAGMQVVSVRCDERGNIDLEDVERQASRYQDTLAALMVTYPSTHGVFEAGITHICEIVHRYGGQVYLDGANLNALVGLCRPAELGVDVCHLNLHKTFCIPHGGGGPGVGPIAVAPHLAPFLPGHPLVDLGIPNPVGPVASAPWGSAGILPIPWMYIRLMGSEGLTYATQIAILNANYIAQRLEPYYPILYTGEHGRVAHECIVDVRPFKRTAQVEVEDIAKRLMDYGFHAPTMSWPVAGTLMIEPTESESLPELDRFCEAMIAIRSEIAQIEQGIWDPGNNPLKNAPHTARMVCADHWPYPYSRQLAAYPASWLREHKFWPSVRRIDNAYGDRHLFCTCAALVAAAD